ncbi:MAG: TIGR02679 family protein [Pseudonocardia sp.]|nr:TIGR02679 family protein [Pseudonocardia sp.]
MNGLPSWLADPALARIWRVLRERLEARGLRTDGRVVLTGLSRAERHAVSALVGAGVTAERVTIDLGELDASLTNRSGVGGLVRVVELATGSPVTDRPGQRANRAVAVAAPFAVARERFPDAAWLEDWLDGVRRAGLLTRSADPVTAVRLAADVLDRLLAGPTSMSRTELAAAVAGGAHGLDDGRTVTALVLRALAAHVGEPVPTTAAGRRKMWERFGVSLDSVSTGCLTLGLRAVVTHTGAGSAAARLALAADAGDPVHLTGWDLRQCTLVPPEIVLVCENPRVLEATAQRFTGQVPVVCVSGQPALVAMDVLHALAGARLHYHGDFDWPGISIANRLIDEVGARPWLMDAEDYLAALGSAGPPLVGQPVAPVWSSELGAIMRRHQMAVHEETVLDSLLAALG